MRFGKIRTTIDKEDYYEIVGLHYFIASITSGKILQLQEPNDYDSVIETGYVYMDKIIIPVKKSTMESVVLSKNTTYIHGHKVEVDKKDRTKYFIDDFEYNLYPLNGVHEKVDEISKDPTLFNFLKIISKEINITNLQQGKETHILYKSKNTYGIIYDNGNDEIKYFSEKKDDKETELAKILGLRRFTVFADESSIVNMEEVEKLLIYEQMENEIKEASDYAITKKLGLSDNTLYKIAAQMKKENSNNSCVSTPKKKQFSNKDRYLMYRVYNGYRKAFFHKAH